MIAPQDALRALRRLGPSSPRDLAADLGAHIPQVRAALSALARLGAARQLPKRRPEVWRATEAAGVVARAAEDREELTRALYARPLGATAADLACALRWEPARTRAALRAAVRAGAARPGDGADLWVWSSAAGRRRAAPSAAEVAGWARLQADGATWAEVAYQAGRTIEAVRGAVSRAAKKDRESVRSTVDSGPCTH